MKMLCTFHQAGGWYGQILYNRKKELVTALMFGSTSLGAFPLIYCVNGNTNSFFFYFMMTLGGFLVSMNGPNVRSVLQGVTAPEIRGSAFAIYNLTDDLGKGGGKFDNGRM